MRPRPALTAIAALPLLLGGLTGCQEEGATAANTQALGGPAPTSAAGPAGVSTRHVSRVGEARLRRLLSVGLRREHTVHVDYRLRERAFTVYGSGDAALVAGQQRMVASVAGSTALGRAEIVVVPRAFYLSAPGLTPAGRWARVDLASPTSPLGPDFARLSDQVDPVSALAALRGGFREVRYLGQRRMYGESMAAYTLSVDSEAGLASRHLAEVGRRIGHRLVYEVWLDRRNRLRKERLRAGGLAMTFELSEWGERVRVHVPSGSELVGPVA